MTQETKRRKALAVLAGGLVLGVGAAVTLAAWNDSEFATGEFSAGSFDLEGATDGAAGAYSDHDTADGAATLAFTLPVAENLSPGDVAYAPFWVRLDASTTSAAQLAATSVVATGANAAHLGYTVHAIDAAATCGAATATTGTQLAAGTSLSAFAASGTQLLAAGAGTAAGAPTQLCFAVTAQESLVAGESAVATWAFTATSE